MREAPRVKIVALVKDIEVPLSLWNRRPVRSVKYKETLLLHPSAEYGAPSMYAVRDFGDPDECVLVHLGRDLKDQEEKEVQVGKKGSLMYMLSQLGYLPLGEFEVEEREYRHRGFKIRVLKIKNVGTFVIVEKKLRSKRAFESAQKRALNILASLGITEKNIIDVDARGLIAMTVLQSAMRR